MCDDIIFTNLLDPCFYNSFNYCCNCEEIFHQTGFDWVATGENVTLYQQRLYREKSDAYKILAWCTGCFGMSVLFALMGCIASLIIGVPMMIMTLLGIPAGFAFGLTLGRYVRYYILQFGLVKG